MQRLATILLLVTATALHAQGPAFDVASLKPSSAGTRTRILIEPGGRLFAEGVSLKFLIAGAWHLQPWQLSGGENWTASETWSVEATAEGISVPAWEPPFLPEIIAARVRSLVNDRFALQSHHETKELAVYRLNIGRNGPKFKATPGPGGRPEDITPPPGRAMAGPGAIAATAIPMQQLVTLLGRWMDRPVIDKTGLTGYVDVRLRFAPESAPRPLPAQLSPDGAAPAPSDYPSIFTAIEEQLGLRLEPAREPIDILVIDSARRPIGN
jgi:uncharacterized protein (TIGR03435 family)